MDVLGAVGGAAGAAVWAVAGSRLVAHLRPRVQLTAFTLGAIACAFAGGAVGSAVDTGPNVAATVRTVAVEPPTTTTVTTVPETTTTAVASTTTTTTPPPAPVVKPVVRRVAPRRSPTNSQTVTGRCADGWGFYGHNEFTHTCDTHGGFGWWVNP